MGTANATLDRAVDTKSGFISGIASTPATDFSGHRVVPRAFDQSIRRKGLGGPGGVKLLHNHKGDPIGRISRLETVRDELRIEASLNLEIASVRELHSAILHNGGLNFSVGFALEAYEFIEPPASDGAWMKILAGDLMEVSVVCFPAQSQAVLDFSKSRARSPAQSEELAGHRMFLAKARADQALLVQRVADLHVQIRAARRKAAERDHLERMWLHSTDMYGNPRNGRNT